MLNQKLLEFSVEFRLTALTQHPILNSMSYLAVVKK